MWATICAGVRVPGATLNAANVAGASRSAFAARYASVATAWRRNRRSELMGRLLRDSDRVGPSRTESESRCGLCASRSLVTNRSRVGVRSRTVSTLLFLRTATNHRQAQSASFATPPADFHGKAPGRMLATLARMSRRERLFTRGLALHVTQRGNNRVATFRKSSDYQMFLLFLRLATTRYRVQVHAYALMPNHFHLMVTPHSPEQLSRTMQSLGRRYVRFFNDRYERTGTLWEGRYRSALIGTERY